MKRIKIEEGGKLVVAVGNNFVKGKIFPQNAYSDKVRLFGKTNKKNTCSESKKKTGSFEKDQKRGKGGNLVLTVGNHFAKGGK